MAAYGVVEIVDENMANAARVHAVERGVAATEHTLVAFGGAAPLHAARLAEKLGLDRMIVPPDAGVGSAIGFLQAPAAYELVKSRFMHLDAFDADAASELLIAMSEEARTLAGAAAGGRALTERRVAYMRYTGQGHEIAVELPLRKLTNADIEAIRTRFEADYRTLFERHIPGARIELLSWSVLVTTDAASPGSCRRTVPLRRPSRPAHAKSGMRPRAADLSIATYQRSAIKPGARVAGPALILEPGTTTLVTAAFTATVDAGGGWFSSAQAATEQGLIMPSSTDGKARMKSNRLGDIEMQVMWNRLIAVVEEQAQTLLRTAFSSIVREGGDLSAGVFDTRGRMLAQAVTGTPGHVNSMAESVKHFIAPLPAAENAAGRHLHHQRSLARHRPSATTSC